jgi:hypothetical protein
MAFCAVRQLTRQLMRSVNNRVRAKVYFLTPRRVAVAAMRSCGILVTYPTKYEQSRAAFPRSALQGAHAAIGGDEVLATGLRCSDAFISNMAPSTEKLPVRMRRDVSLPCGTRCSVHDLRASTRHVAALD